MKDAALPPALWTTKHCSERTQLCLSYIKRLVANGQIPHLKIGRSVRFDPRAIEEWLATKQRGPKV